jgi:hypothetical protein
MDPSIWTTLGSIAALVWTGWHSRKSNRQTKATGNGFAKHVLDDLKVIKGELKEQRVLLTEHLADHAGSDLRK